MRLLFVHLIFNYSKLNSSVISDIHPCSIVCNHYNKSVLHVCISFVLFISIEVGVPQVKGSKEWGNMSWLGRL